MKTKPTPKQPLETSIKIETTTKIKITLQGKEFNLTKEEAKIIYKELFKLFGETKELQPNPPSYPMTPTYIPNEFWKQPEIVPLKNPFGPLEITCKS